MNDPEPEITELFVQESSEHLERLERELIELEDRPDDAALLASVFRSVHTIKGTSGFLAFPRLEALTHAGEEVLAALRDGRLHLSPGVTSALLALIDDVRQALAAIEQTGAEGPADHAATVAALRALLEKRTPHPPPSPQPRSEDDRTATERPLPESQPDQPLPPTAHPSPAVAGPDAAAAVPDDARVPTAAAAPGTSVATTPAGDTTVRIGVDLLDRIMELTGELVVLRSRLSAVIGDDDGAPVTGISRDLRTVTTDLQSEVMRSRLQPVGVVLGRFRRIARDLAHSLGKQVQVEITGEEVAVDRAINDALRDPLLHLVRNAVDHGLESPQVRTESGKDPAGRLMITASHGHGRVRIDVRDDGRGMKTNALRRRAQQTGLISAEEAQALSERDALELALRPGISTSSEVTTLSGRGVGLDVVSSVLATVGGRVDITTEPGSGTCFSVNVPLTLAMLPVLTVTCAGQTYCLPQANVVEIRDLSVDGSAITTVDGVPIYRLRGQLLPLVGLAEVLAGDGSGVTAQRVVIVETDERRFAMRVPGTGDTLDVVVKPMTPETRGNPLFMGISILADGRPALILDVAGVADAAGVTSRAEEAVSPELPSAPATESAIVVAGIRGGGAVAVRLTDVVRLERFDRAAVKRHGAGAAVMYGDEVLPLLAVADLLPERRQTPREDSTDGRADTVPAIVCRVAGRLVGLVVREILDVVPEPTAPAQPASRPGVVASLYLREQFAEVLDLPVLLTAAGLEQRS